MDETSRYITHLGNNRWAPKRGPSEWPGLRLEGRVAIMRRYLCFPDGSLPNRRVGTPRRSLVVVVVGLEVINGKREVFAGTGVWVFVWVKGMSRDDDLIPLDDNGRRLIVLIFANILVAKIGADLAVGAEAGIKAAVHVVAGDREVLFFDFVRVQTEQELPNEPPRVRDSSRTLPWPS